jgi:hypothetical protein
MLNCGVKVGLVSYLLKANEKRMKVLVGLLLAEINNTISVNVFEV